MTVLQDLRPGDDLLTVTTHPLSPCAVVIAVRGELDLNTSPLLQADLLAQVRPVGPHLIVDLTEVGFVGAAGLTVLVTVRKAALAAGGLSLVAHTRQVLLPLRVTKLDRAFAIYPDLAHAVLGLGVGPVGDT